MHNNEPHYRPSNAAPSSPGHAKHPLTTPPSPTKPPNPPYQGGYVEFPYQGGYVEFLDRGATEESPPDKGDLGGFPTHTTAGAMSTRFAVPPRAWMRAAALKTGCFPAPQRGVRGASPPQGGRGGIPTNSDLTGTTDPATATDHRPAPADATGRVGAIAPLTPQPPLSGGLC